MELRRFNDEKEKEISHVTSDLRRTMSEAREQWNEKESRLIHEFETERKNLINQYEQTVRELQRKCDTLTEKNTNLSEAK